jgi:hypothetical protein
VAINDDRSKTPRTLMVAEHLWEAFAMMAVEMGSDRDALINQALYTFARLNGFLVPADLKRLAPSAPPESSRPRPVPVPPVADHGPRPQANPDRVAEIAQQLSAGGMPSRPSSNPPPLPPSRSEPVPPALVEVDDSLLGEEGQATSMELPNIASMKSSAGMTPNRTQEIEEFSDQATPGGARALVLLADGRELDRVIKDRFLIGRGKHCDLIINSGKVSREHAAITREGTNYFIEDLGSSNGTWFDKRRISRRQIQDGDEYFICSEKLSCVFR